MSEGALLWMRLRAQGELAVSSEFIHRERRMCNGLRENPVPSRLISREVHLFGRSLRTGNFGTFRVTRLSLQYKST